jgi:hypothetical protein
MTLGYLAVKEAAEGSGGFNITISFGRLPSGFDR